MTYQGSKVCQVQASKDSFGPRFFFCRLAVRLSTFLTPQAQLFIQWTILYSEQKKSTFRKVQLERVKCVTVVVCAKMNENREILTLKCYLIKDTEYPCVGLQSQVYVL